MSLQWIRFFSLLIFILAHNFLYSQVITGDFLNKSENSEVQLLISEKSKPDQVKEFFSVRTNTFEYYLKKDYDTILITINSLYYNTEYLTIKPPLKNEKKHIQIRLSKTNLIEEVIIEGNRKKFTVKKDTITYNVSSYADGSENKIEDVIRKLPGVEVDDTTGQIKYKGKSIETVTIEGDNLFGNNYTLGTKNINVNLVEQIEAIDNFSENNLLKTIEKSDKVALNLKIKKGKFDFSGNADYGSGISKNKNSFKINANILGIKKNYKSFGTIAYNNVGINNTPFDYFNLGLSSADLNEIDYVAAKNISDYFFNNKLSDKRTNINNQLFGNYNNIINLGSKLKLKANIYYSSDKINGYQLLSTNYLINNENFQTTDDTYINKEPKQFRFNFETKFNSSKSSLLEYSFNVKKENIFTYAHSIQNQLKTYTSQLSTDNFFIKQDILWTKKISENNALQFSFNNSINSIPQSLTIYPSLLDDSTMNIQHSKFRKLIYEAKAIFLGNNKNNNYSFTIGGNYQKSPFISSFNNENAIFYQNDNNYIKKYFFTTGVYNFNLSKLEISPSYSFKILSQNLIRYIGYNNQLSKDDIFIEPSLRLKYNINPLSFLSANYSFKKETNSELFFFTNPIITDFRTSKTNTPSLELQERQSFSLLYFNNNLYKQLQITAFAIYQKANGNFINNSIISENFTNINYFYSPSYNDNFSFNFQISKYLSFINSVLKLSSNYSISNLKNIVNNSQLNNNQNQFISNSLHWRSTFDFLFNFENEFFYKVYSARINANENLLNKELQNNFKINFKPSKNVMLVLSSDYYLPTIDNKNNSYNFIDILLKYKPKNKNWEASFDLKNVTNNKEFQYINVSSISTTYYYNQILPRFYLLNLVWKF